MIRIVIFASGSGTNAENIIKYFEKSKKIQITNIVSNNGKAGVLERANRLNVPVKVFSKNEMRKALFIQFLKKEADYLILAGFLLKIPESIILSFRDRIINIHPALLPKYGGKGMYGMYIHEAVVKNNEQNTGITIHLVNENYDEGAILFQKEVLVLKNDTAKDVAAKIHQLEQENFPKVIEQILTGNL